MIESGTILQDRFLVEEQIGVGGMGAVYRAVDRKFGTSVAIKETFYKDPALAEAFEREARLLNGLHHPLFPHVSDHFVEGNGHFLVMEYIEGDDLSALQKRGERFSVETVVRWALDLLDGLDYLHSQDPPIIHRDVKPSNLRLTERGNLVLLDFGMAKETSGNTEGMRSVFGYSRRYSPLEQIEGTGTDVRSDIFSLGATVYHLATGTPPIDVLARASAIVVGRPDPLRLASELNPDIPEAMAAVLHSALALDPDKRFISARAMWNAVEAAMDADPNEGPSAAAPVTPATEGFPALDAFENDAELNRPAPTHAAPQQIPRPFNLRSALIGLLAVFVLGLFGYGLYQRAGNEEDQNAGQVVLETPPVPQSENTTAISEEPLQENFAPPETSEGETIADAERSGEVIEDAQPVPAPARRTQTSDDMGSTSGKKTRSPVEKPKDRPARSVSSRNIDRGSDRQAPVSSIESVLTGMPDRTRQQRQWEIWREEEEIRRQRRLRRQTRQNRLRYPY